MTLGQLENGLEILHPVKREDTTIRSAVDKKRSNICKKQTQERQRCDKSWTWDIRDSVLPEIDEPDVFEAWPEGPCKRAYSCRHNSEAIRHSSGWAMRNTNNHNVNILKKSCLGVLVCNLRCSKVDPQQVGKAPVYWRPAICDKARTKQIGQPCRTSGCSGVLQLQRCQGRNGYPVTHFWRFNGQDLMFFQSKGTHNHPRPVKLCPGARERERRQVGTGGRRVSGARSGQGHKSTGSRRNKIQDSESLSSDLAVKPCTVVKPVQRSVEQVVWNIKQENMESCSNSSVKGFTGKQSSASDNFQVKLEAIPDSTIGAENFYQSRQFDATNSEWGQNPFRYSGNIINHSEHNGVHSNRSEYNWRIGICNLMSNPYQECVGYGALNEAANMEILSKACSDREYYGKSFDGELNSVTLNEAGYITPPNSEFGLSPPRSNAFMNMGTTTVNNIDQPNNRCLRYLVENVNSQTSVSQQINGQADQMYMEQSFNNFNHELNGLTSHTSWQNSILENVDSSRNISQGNAFYHQMTDVQNCFEKHFPLMEQSSRSPCSLSRSPSISEPVILSNPLSPFKYGFYGSQPMSYDVSDNIHKCYANGQQFNTKCDSSFYHQMQVETKESQKSGNNLRNSNGLESCFDSSSVYSSLGSPMSSDFVETYHGFSETSKLSASELLFETSSQIINTGKSNSIPSTLDEVLFDLGLPLDSCTDF